MSRLKQVLQTLAHQPRTTLELAEQLNSSEGALLGMLETLLRGGFISQAMPPQAGGCGACSLKSMCRVADQNPQEVRLHLYRLTPKGLSYLES